MNDVKQVSHCFELRLTKMSNKMYHWEIGYGGGRWMELARVNVVALISSVLIACNLLPHNYWFHSCSSFTSVYYTT